VILVNCYASHCSEEDFQWLDQLDDSQLVTNFNNTSFDSLMTLADVNPRFRELILNHTAISKYHINEKHINIVIQNHSNETSPESVEFSDDLLIKVLGNATPLKFLRIFGPKVLSIIKHCSKNGEFDEHSKINRYINEYCSDSLQAYWLYSNVDTADAWEKPFKQLTTLFLSGKLANCEKTNFSEIFPLLTVLGLISDNIPDNQKLMDCFKDHHFPNTKRLTLKGAGKNELKFFELNPQIEELSIIGDVIEDLEYLRAVSEKLPNLQYFGADIDLPDNISEQMRNNLIHFKNVKLCSIRIRMNHLQRASVIPIVFDQLEEMHLDTWYVHEHDVWTEFLKRHNKLKVFGAPLVYINEQVVKMIVELMPNLIELKVYKLKEIRDDAVTTLINGLKNLKKISLGTSESNEGNCELLRNSLNSTWQIECNSAYWMILTRI